MGAGGGRLYRGHLVGFNTAQLGCRVQHADASQQRGVHLGTQGHESTYVTQRLLPFPDAQVR